MNMNYRVIRRITDIMFIVLIAVMAVMYIPGIAGFKSYRVLSASMEPGYHVGSMVYVRPADMQDIHDGDVITFYVNDSTLVTHRVVSRSEDDSGFITKGDANEVNDGGVASYDNIVGKVVVNIPLLGYISSWLGSAYGKCMTIGVLLVITLMEIIINKREKLDNQHYKKSGEYANN